MVLSYLAQHQIPWRYGLRFNKTNFALCIDIHPELVDYINEEMDVKNNIFHIREGASYGYDSVGKVSKTDTVTTLTFNLLNKKDKGDKLQVRFKNICKTISDLTTFFQSYLFEEGEGFSHVDTQLPLQLFEFDIAVFDSYPHANPIQGYVGPILRQFLKEQGELDYKEAVKFRDEFIGQSAKFFGYKAESLINFKNDGRFLVQVPGNACDIGIYGEESDRPISQGATFHSHNLDTAKQQLGLLIGLGMILNWYYEKYSNKDYRKPS